MNLKLTNKKFIICGATSCFGLSIAKILLNENATIISIARNKENLEKLYSPFKDKAIIYQGDITNEEVIDDFLNQKYMNDISGIVVNAGGPPKKSFFETSIEDWDNAYNQLVR